MIAAMISLLFWIFPLSIRREVAVALISSGNSIWFTLMPVPGITYWISMSSVLISVKIPQIFFLFKTRSFGHLISDFNPVAFSIPLLVDSAMTSVSMEAAMGSICGLKSMLIQIPTPAGDVQTRPLLPFPPSWRSATARVPWGAPCSARRRISLFVESVSSKNATCVPAHFVWIVLSSSSFESTSADPFKIYPLFRTASIS